MRQYGFTFFATGLACLILVSSSDGLARRLFINGTEASNLGQVDLRKVDLHIDHQGDIYITAPHYELTTAEKFVPLQDYWQSRPGASPTGTSREMPPSHPEHQAPGLIPKGGSQPSSRSLSAIPGAAQIPPGTHQTAPAISDAVQTPTSDLPVAPPNAITK